MKKIFIMLLSMLSLTACGAKTTEKNSESMKPIVIFFSHAGENYSVGVIQEGNTKLVTDIICERTGADRLEIVCTKDYDLPYMELIEVAKKEQQDGELPGFTLLLNGKAVEKADLSAYDTVYVGGPIWWGTYPQVMFSFFESYDLNGKTILPFTTHEGSGLGNCVSDLKAAYPNATFGKAFSLYGHEVRTDSGKKKVEAWVK